MPEVIFVHLFKWEGCCLQPSPPNRGMLALLLYCSYHRFCKRRFVEIHLLPDSVIEITQLTQFCIFGAISEKLQHIEAPSACSNGRRITDKKKYCISQFNIKLQYSLFQIMPPIAAAVTAAIIIFIILHITFSESSWQCVPMQAVRMCLVHTITG